MDPRDRQNLLDLRALQASRNGTPCGYVNPNGVVTVWTEGRGQNNYINREMALAAIPTLNILGEQQ